MSRTPPYRKISVVVTFAALLLFHAGGWSLASLILQFQAKSAAHVALHRHETPLETVALAADFLSKIRIGKKEIRLEGRLYDIKNQTVKGDSVTLQLYHDKHEEAVLDAVGKLLSPSGGSDAALPLQIWLAKWLVTAFVPPPAKPEVQFYCYEISPSFFAYLLPLAQHAPSDFSPPPERGSLIL